ncbi:FadR/GntR family transcriptional regulator [Kutzneria viridogrisea]|uniref:HTH gntR-type domain-containing protein n=2 Tax=Kutzneria TaxID=43356 RepID=W5WER0_9PSEU|nr:FadR/GntR family transcriptional regulator [Kutzneria albida]AHH99337.1 hypothetical protein KALB_5977 [Kutzneria albida DSM 43870]MBA8923108.1 GntR family transcriptional repressor for pyruvate dehydrogenase complex [Kutzneria viridogrisea]
MARENLSDSLTAGILDLAGELAVGQALPSVRDLAERFEVTAPTIREALRRLQATGTVELRHGSGIYVGPNVHRTVLPNPNLTRPTLERVLDLVQARSVLEPGIAAHAARHRTESDVAHLREVLKDATRNHTAGEGAAPLRWNFHRELARAANNPVLYEVVDTLLVANSREQSKVRKIYTNRLRDIRQHRALVDAVADRDPTAAHDLMRDHLAEIQHAVEKRLVVN